MILFFAGLFAGAGLGIALMCVLAMTGEVVGDDE